MSYTSDIIDALVEYYLAGEKNLYKYDNPKLLRLLAALDELAKSTDDEEFAWVREELCEEYGRCHTCGGKMEFDEEEVWCCRDCGRRPGDEKNY